MGTRVNVFTMEKTKIRKGVASLCTLAVAGDGAGVGKKPLLASNIHHCHLQILLRCGCQGVPAVPRPIHPCLSVCLGAVLGELWGRRAAAAGGLQGQRERRELRGREAGGCAGLPSGPLPG